MNAFVKTRVAIYYSYTEALTSVPPVKVKEVIASSPTAPATGLCAARNVPETVYLGFVAPTVVSIGMISTVVVVPTSG
jgi:hypothetical protein